MVLAGWNKAYKRRIGGMQLKNLEKMGEKELLRLIVRSVTNIEHKLNFLTCDHPPEKMDFHTSYRGEMVYCLKCNNLLHFEPKKMEG